MTAPTLTDADIEKIARRYCEAMGIDPEGLVPIGKPRWQILGEMVRTELAWKIALAGYGEKGDE